MKKKFFCCALLAFVSSFSLAEAVKIKLTQVAVLDLQKTLQVVLQEPLMQLALRVEESEEPPPVTLLKELEELKARLSLLQLDANSDLLQLANLRDEIAYKEQQLQAWYREQEQEAASSEKTLPPLVAKGLYRLIKTLAQQEGYALVLEKSAAVIYANETVELTPLLLERLEQKKAELQ